MTPEYDDGTVTLYAGDCLDVLAGLPDASVDAVVTDPPYGLEFMGKEWDAPWKGSSAAHANARTKRAAELDDPSKGKFIRAGVNAYEAGLPFQQWCEQWAAECLRVLKPGGYLAAFGGTRTWHRLACAIEDAGFEIRDALAWMYGSGFPKSHNLTDEWQGWGTALKPAYEPIVLARKPLAGTVAANVQSHGTGALNIDGCRVGTEQVQVNTYSERGPFGDSQVGNEYASKVTTGRWPANVVLDDTAAAMLDAQSHGDTGGASRFFYTAKAGRDERPTVGGVAHPTVKPLDLMRWLVRLVTLPGGVVLEPFAGSGTTAEACIIEGFRCIAIEREPDYIKLIRARLSKAIQPTLDDA